VVRKVLIIQSAVFFDHKSGARYEVCDLIGGREGTRTPDLTDVNIVVIVLSTFDRNVRLSPFICGQQTNLKLPRFVVRLLSHYLNMAGWTHSLSAIKRMFLVIKLFQFILSMVVFVYVALTTVASETLP